MTDLRGDLEHNIESTSKQLTISNHQLAPVVAPGENNLKAFPDIQPGSPVTADDSHGPEWKPSKGMPNKPPIPNNIFVPDPQPVGQRLIQTT